MPEYLWEKLTRLASLSGLRLLRFQPLQENNTNCIVFDKPASVFFFANLCLPTSCLKWLFSKGLVLQEKTEFQFHFLI